MHRGVVPSSPPAIAVFRRMPNRVDLLLANRAMKSQRRASAPLQPSIPQSKNSPDSIPRVSSCSLNLSEPVGTAPSQGNPSPRHPVEGAPGKATQSGFLTCRHTASATAGSTIPGPLPTPTDREQRLQASESQLRAHTTDPNTFRIELKRLEAEARKRVAELQSALESNPEEARAVVFALLDGGHLTARPIETENGRRFLLEGTTVVGNLLACEPVSNSASPTGFEPVLQP